MLNAIVRRICWGFVQWSWVTGARDLDLLRPVSECAKHVRTWQSEVVSIKAITGHQRSLDYANLVLIRYKENLASLSRRCEKAEIPAWKIRAASH